MKIVFERYEKRGPNGDRATKSTTYYDYAVSLSKQLAEEKMIIAKFSGYDHFRTHVRSLNEISAKANKYVAELAQFMELPAPNMVKMVKREIITEEWAVDGAGEEDDE